MIDVNPLEVVLFGVCWLIAGTLIKTIWTYMRENGALTAIRSEAKRHEHD